MNQKSRYAQAGVDIQAGDQVKKRIGELVKNDTYSQRPS